MSIYVNETLGFLVKDSELYHLPAVSELLTGQCIYFGMVPSPRFTCRSLEKSSPSVFCDNPFSTVEPENRIGITFMMLRGTENCVRQYFAPLAGFRRDSWGLVLAPVVVRSLRHP